MAALALALAGSPAVAQPPAPGSPYVLDGPSSAIAAPADLGVSVARDGTGGLAYLKAVGGTTHVFVSRLAGGLFGAPVQIDSGLAGASSQPVIAAGNGGVLLVAFVNSGQLYVVNGNGQGQFAAPLGLAGGAVNPAISMSNFGKAYVAFAAADGSGHDIRTAYYDGHNWTLEAPALNATPADDAGGSGAAGPSVATAGDGIAIVAWAEQGHIYSRRVWGTSASVVYEQADAPIGGCVQTAVDQPVIAAGGNSSFAPVAFHAALYCGGKTYDRVLLNRLHGSTYDGVVEADGLSAGSPDGAADPQVAVGEYGGGWVTSERTRSNNVIAALLGPNSVLAGSGGQVNSLPAAQPPYPVPAMAGFHADLIAWQQEPGSVTGGEIRVRFAPDGVTLGPESVLSSPAQGPTDAADGLAAAGDISGDVAVAWLQGPPGGMQVVVNQLYQPPSNFSSTKGLVYTSNPQPVLGWTRPNGWGPMRYSVTLDGSPAGQTYSTSMQVPTPLGNGPHGWQVTATNPAGQESGAPSSTVFVDTVAPMVTLRQLVRAVAGSRVRVVVRYADRPPQGQPFWDASGVAAVVIRWGDGSVTRVRPGTHFVSHRYRRRGRYRIRVFVTDRAGNRTRLVKLVKVFARGK